MVSAFECDMPSGKHLHKIAIIYSPLKRASCSSNDVFSAAMMILLLPITIISEVTTLKNTAHVNFDLIVTQ